MFTLYSIAKFIHITDALGMFVVIGIEWLCLVSLRRTNSIETIKQFLEAYTDECNKHVKEIVQIKNAK